MNKDILWIKAKCNNYERIMPKLHMLGIKLYEVRYESNVIYLKVERKNYEKISKYLISYKFEIDSNTGIAKVKDIVKKERIFVIAIIIGTCLFFCLSNMIMEVNVIHENKDIRELIKDELDLYGIKVLRFKKSYKELDVIRNKILDKYPEDLDWMEFDVEGMVVNVRVEERIITNTKNENKYCDLVAKKAGVINDLAIFTGEAAVGINDYVRPGDVLVKGTIMYNEEAKRYTCAKGEVYATVWYTANVSIPLKYSKKEETGKKKYNLVWESNGNKKKILRERFKDYNSYLKSVFRIFDYNLYIETEKETKKIDGIYTEEEALNEGINKAVESVKVKLGDKDTIIDKKVLKKAINNSTMDIEVFIIVKELISTEKEIVIEEGIE